MKKIAIIIGLFLCSSLYSMNTEESWYTRLSRQYPNTKKIVNNGLLCWCASYGLDFIGTVFNVKINPVFTNYGTILFSFGLKTVYDYVKQPDILESVQTSPQLLLQHNNIVNRIALDFATFSFVRKNLHKNWLENNAITREWMLQNINFFKKKYSSIFLLDECRREDNRYCTLGRNWQPEYRNVYENTLVRIMTKKFDKSDEEIHYVDFGHGMLFQTFVTITKMLIKNNTAKLSLHLIDAKNLYYVKMRDLLKNGRQIGKSLCDQPDSVMKQFKECIKSALEDNDLLLDKELLIKKNLFYTSELLRQLDSFFEDYFPKACVKIFVYSSTDDFCSHLEKNKFKKNKLKPDVVTAVDIQDPHSCFFGAHYNYVKLCLSVLRENPRSHNIWLQNSGKGASLVKIHNKLDKKFKGYEQKKGILKINNNCTATTKTFYENSKEIRVNWLGNEKW